MNIIRSYLSKQIQTLYPKLRAWDNDYSYQEAPGNKLDETYLILIGDYTPTQESNHVLHVVPVVVRIPKLKKTRGEQLTKDDCIDMGSKVLAQIVHPKNYKDFVISSIKPEKMIVENSANNSDIFEITLNFTFEIYQSL